MNTYRAWHIVATEIRNLLAFISIIFFGGVVRRSFFIDVVYYESGLRTAP